MKDSSKRVTVQGIADSGCLPIAPNITVEIYDQNVPAVHMAPVVSIHVSGKHTLKYKVGGHDTVDESDPLSMAVARDIGIGIEVGMVMARIEEEVDGEITEKYRVIFNDGEGYLGDKDGILRMRSLFIQTPGLEPIIVVMERFIGV